jgi:Alginate export
MRTYGLLMLVLLVGASGAPGRVNAQAAADSSANRPPAAAPDPPARDNGPEWLFPVEQLDERLPSWLRIGGEYRDRLEGPIGIGYTGTNDFYLLDRLRVQVTIQPKEWLTFHGEVQDSRIFFNHHIANANPFEDSWTLWEGYAQLGSSTSGWLDGLAGRQVLLFGDERVIGPSNWLNVGRTFNVARVDLHQPGATLSVFASSVVPGDNADLHNALQGNNFYGVYGSFDNNVVPQATFEPYVLWRVAPPSPLLPEEVNHGHLNEVTIGLHVEGTLPKEFDYDAEFDGQTGSLGVYSIGAWAGYVGGGKKFSSVATAPRVYLEGNYASGTKNPAGRDWNTFDSLYPSNHDKEGFADQVGRRNLVQFRVGVEEHLSKKWRIRQSFEGFWLATSNDNFYASSGAIAVPARPGASRHIGNELDLIAEYKMNKGLNFGFGYARLFAGQFLQTTTRGHDYQYPYAYMEYNFSKSGSVYGKVVRSEPPGAYRW